MAEDTPLQPPLAVYEQHLREGRLAYQFSRVANRAVFQPRIACPWTGSTDLEWRISKGVGTVHAVTVVHGREGPTHNVVLVDLDEGFRLMSRVDVPDPQAVRIGLRVRARIHAPEDGGLPYPVFEPLAEPGDA